jgi:hypothetical protein
MERISETAEYAYYFTREELVNIINKLKERESYAHRSDDYNEMRAALKSLFGDKIRDDTQRNWYVKVRTIPKEWDIWRPHRRKNSLAFCDICISMVLVLKDHYFSDIEKETDDDLILPVISIFIEGPRKSAEGIESPDDPGYFNTDVVIRNITSFIKPGSGTIVPDPVLPDFIGLFTKIITDVEKDLEMQRIDEEYRKENLKRQPKAETYNNGGDDGLTEHEISVLVDGGMPDNVFVTGMTINDKDNVTGKPDEWYEARGND